MTARDPRSELMEMLAILYSKLESINDHRLDDGTKQCLIESRAILKLIADFMHEHPSSELFDSSNSNEERTKDAAISVPQDQSKEEKEEAGMPLKILIVDDDEDVHRMLGFALRKHDFEVVSYLNPIDAMANLQNIHPQIILLDLMMPQMSGFEFLRIIDTHPLRKTFKIAVGSSRSYDKDRISVQKAGANDFIAKPYNLSELVLRLRHLAA